MTTIAWDGKTLAADRLLSCGNARYTVAKIRRLDDGRLIGAAGTDGPAAMEHVAGNMAALPEDLKKGETTVCVIHPGGRAEHWNGESRYVVLDPFWAIGSGRDFATAAMHLGKTAAEAVEIAARFDNGTGLGVDTMELLP